MTTKKQEKIKFSKAFWVANTVELFERAAYYGVFIVITLYLSRILGFNDIQAASIAGIFSACLYLLPTFAGALADKIGFRNSMLLAFTLLTCGYLGLAVTLLGFNPPDLLNTARRLPLRDCWRAIFSTALSLSWP